MERLHIQERPEPKYLLPLIAAREAIGLSMKYRSALRITAAETRHYLGKSYGFATFFSGFAHQLTRREAVGAGKAAFYACAYDVTSDWGKGHDTLDAFIDIAYTEAPPDRAKRALAMLEKDLNGQLAHDGLERGSISTRLIMETMGVLGHYEAMTDVDALGMNLQMVDDVFDRERDLREGQQNCFNSRNARIYAARLITDLTEETTQKLFPHGEILRWKIRQARNKATDMLLY